MTRPSKVGARRASNLLHNISEVIHYERQRRAPLSDSAEQAIDRANHGVDNVSDVVEGGDEQRIEVEALEDAIDDVDEIAQAHDELELGVDVGDGDVDFLHRDGDTGVDLHESGDVGIQIDVRLEVVDVEFDTPNGELWHIEVDIGNRGVGIGRAGAGAASTAGAVYWSG